MNDWLSLLFIPAAGWIVSVEQRLTKLGTKLENIEQGLDRVEKGVDAITAHLLKDTNDQGQDRRYPEESHNRRRAR